MVVFSLADIVCVECSFLVRCTLFMTSCSFFFFKQKTAYEMRISDWSSDVCSSDLLCGRFRLLNLRGTIGASRAAPVDTFQQHRQQIGRASCRERVCQYV